MKVIEARRIEPLLESFFAITVGLLAGSIFMAAFGYNPILGYFVLFNGGFGDLSKILESLAYAMPIIITGASFTISARSGVFNLGLEGQAYLGAIGAVYIAGTFHLPPVIHIAAATVFGMLLGALWSLPAAILKIWKGVSEIISTIMLNWIAYYLTIYIAIDLLADPETPHKTISALPSARYIRLTPRSTLTAGIFIALAFCVLIYFLLWHTAVGFELRLAGTNPDAALYAGVDPKKVTLISFILSGLGAGLAGTIQVIGRPPGWCLYTNLGNVLMVGYDGISVALMGRNHPIGCIVSAFFYGGLLNGSRLMESRVGIYSELARALIGIIIMIIAIPELMNIIKRRLK
ncbi:MAG: ABC transporter permease [Thermoproteota archaeon]|nr:MAG: ABC transporter permease [Candidatus Korarchaeota archaeon]